jgi:hypothetical protein
MNACSELHYTHLLNAIPVPMFIVDEDVRILDLNVAACRAFGLSKGAISLKRGGEVLHCLHSEEVPEGCGRAVMCKNCIVRNAVADCRNAVSTTQRRMKFGSIAESVGKRAMEKDTPWKSPRAGLSHCAWKSARASDFHFYHSPGDGELSFRSDSGKK